jgi:hypothetical protein
MKSRDERRSGWLLIIGIVVGVLALTAGPALAALTFSGTSISGDGAVVIDSLSSISIGTSTATGVTIGRTGQAVNFPGDLSATNLVITGNATTTNLAIMGLGSSGTPCLSVNATGNVATTTCGGGSSQFTNKQRGNFRLQFLEMLMDRGLDGLDDFVPVPRGLEPVF